jgi:hypothetical protein
LQSSTGTIYSIQIKHATKQKKGNEFWGMGWDFLFRPLLPAFEELEGLFGELERFFDDL